MTLLARTCPVFPGCPALTCPHIEARDIERRWPLRVADRQMRKRTCMADLWPDMRPLHGCMAGEGSDCLPVGAGSGHQVPGFLRVAGVALNLANDRHGSSALGPPFVESALRLGGVVFPVPERIRHRRSCQLVLEDGAAWQLEWCLKFLVRFQQDRLHCIYASSPSTT